MSAIFETEFPDYLTCGECRTKASTAKIVLLAIADHANDEGESAYPGLTRLEKKTGLSRQGIVDTLKVLVFNGLLLVDDEPSKLNTNNYTVVTSAYPTLQNYDNNDSSQATLLVKPLDYPSQATLPEVVKPLDLKHSLITNKPLGENEPVKESPSKKGDILDGILFYEQQGLDQKINEIEKVFNTLEKGLKRNIPRHPTWQDLAKWIIKQGNVDEWIDWYMADEFRISTSWRLNPEQIRNSWPQAPKKYIQQVKPKNDEPKPVYADLSKLEIFNEAGIK